MKICEVCGEDTKLLFSVIAGYEGEILNCGVCKSCKDKFNQIIRGFQLDKITSKILKELED